MTTRTVESLMTLADRYARADVERGIPTGGLYRGITHNAYVEAREALRSALREALEEHAALLKENREMHSLLRVQACMRESEDTRTAP